MSAVLNIKDASVGYTTSILSNINLNLKAGKLYCLIGKNGAGKSTILKSILQDIPFLKGDISLFDKSISDYSVKNLAQKISIVYSTRIPSTILVSELIELGRQPYTGFLGRLKPEDYSKINEVVSQTKIETLLNKKVDDLSDGQYQKVMFARALVQDTDLVLLDEPTSFLDPNNKVQILQLLQKTARESKKTILFSSHDIDLAKRFADEFILVHNESIEQVSKTDSNIESKLKKLFPEI